MTIPSKDIRNSSDPDIAGSYYAMLRAGISNRLYLQYKPNSVLRSIRALQQYGIAHSIAQSFIVRINYCFM